MSKWKPVKNFDPTTPKAPRPIGRFRCPTCKVIVLVPWENGDYVRCDACGKRWKPTEVES